MNIVLFGPPGAGKGTQGDKLSKKFELIKISTGDLLRAEVKTKSILGKKIKPIIDKGILVSDDILNKLIESVISISLVPIAIFLLYKISEIWLFS